MICGANVDLGYEDPMFHVLGRNLYNLVPLGYFSRYNASFDPYCMYTIDAPRKIMCNTFIDFSFDFSIVFGLLKRAPSFFIVIILKSFTIMLVTPMMWCSTIFYVHSRSLIC